MNEDYNISSINVIDFNSMNLCEIIFEIEKRPLMLLPEKHIKYLGTFINGYIYGSRSPEDSEIFVKFDRYIEKKYKINTTHGWVRNIDHMSSDPHTAFENFFNEFREYLESM